MAKETDQRGKRTEMQRTILKLEARNSAVDGILLATFGKGKSRALVFPTPVTIQENGVPVADELLVVTNDGYRLVHCDRGQEGIEARHISTIVTERFGKKDGFLSGVNGYANKELSLSSGGLDISRKGTRDFRDADPLWGGGQKFYNNCRLVEADENRVEQILQANIERVRQTQAQLLKR